MDITPPLLAGTNFINSYSNQGFKINGKQVTGNIVLSPTETYAWDIDNNIFALDNYHYFIKHSLARARAGSIVLIGTGEKAESAPQNLFKLFDQYGVYPEVMLTAAACRTYNVLITEQRSVFALLKKI